MDPYIGELRVFPYTFVPRGWAACNGQLMAVQSNQALFSILGTLYGGDGRNTFGLPDLQGRTPMHVSSANTQGAKGGTNGTTLNLSNLPAHTHPLKATSTPTTTAVPNPGTPAGNILGVPSDNEFTLKGSNALVPMATTAVGLTGSATPVSNMQPYLGLNICIATTGIYPSRG